MRPLLGHRPIERLIVVGMRNVRHLLAGEGEADEVSTDTIVEEMLAQVSAG